MDKPILAEDYDTEASNSSQSINQNYLSLKLYEELEIVRRFNYRDF
jgi:hypothetical protein